MYLKFAFVIIILTQETFSLPKIDKNHKIRSIEIVKETKGTNFLQKEHFQLKSNIEQHGDFTNSAVAKDIHGHKIENKITLNIVDELLGKAKESIDKLKSLVEGKIHEASEILEKIRQKIIDDGLYAIELVKRQLKYLNVKTIKAIEKIEKKSDEAGVDIRDCMTDSSDRLEKLFQEFYSNEIKCVEKEVEEVLHIIYQTIDVFHKAYQTVVDLPQKLKNCSNSNNSIECVTDVIVEITQIEKELPDKITQKVEEAQDFLDKFSTKLQTCAVKEIGNAGIKAAGIVSDVAKCAAEKERNQGIVHLERNNVYTF